MARSPALFPGNTKNPIPFSSGRRQLYLMLGLCLIALLAYANSFYAGFTFDNRGLLLEDPRIREASRANFELILSHTYWWPYGESGLYRPFTTLSYLFNYAVCGNAGRPFGYHVVNFLLHCLNILLVFALARKLLAEEWPAAFIAALWAVHPVLTESVTNIVGRADLLAGVSILGGLYIYLQSAEANGRKRWTWLTALMLVTLFGVFSKESAVMLPVVILLWELLNQRRMQALFLGCAATMIPIALMLYQRATVMANLPPASFPAWDNPITMADFWTGKLTALKVCALYLGRLAWPWQLSCDYSFQQIPLYSSGDLGLLFLVVAVAFGIAFLYRYRRIAFFFAAFSVVTFLPTSNLLFSMGTIMAERFLYLPAIGFASLVVLGLHRLGERLAKPGLMPTVVCILVLLFSVRTWKRNADWQDQITLMTATVEASPASYKSHMLLAAALFDSGPSNLDQALAAIEKSMAIVQPLPEAKRPPSPYELAGRFYLAKGDYRRAFEVLTLCRRIVKANVRDAADAARADGRPVPEADPSRMAALDRTLSEVALRLNDSTHAVESAENAIAADPMNSANYRRLSAAYQAAGRTDESAIALVKGSLVTEDMSLRQELLDRYRKGLDTEGCAVQSGPNGPAMNPNCEIVRRHSCAGVAGAMRIFIKMNRSDAALRLKASVVGSIACPAQLLDAAFSQ